MGLVWAAGVAWGQQDVVPGEVLDMYEAWVLTQDLTDINTNPELCMTERICVSMVLAIRPARWQTATAMRAACGLTPLQPPSPIS